MYVLILVIHLGVGTEVVMHDFDSPHACEAAGKAAIEMAGGNDDRRIAYRCITKSVP